MRQCCHRWLWFLRLPEDPWQQAKHKVKKAKLVQNSISNVKTSNDSKELKIEGAI